jgi:hypothetical protein
VTSSFIVKGFEKKRAIISYMFPAIQPKYSATTSCISGQLSLKDAHHKCAIDSTAD